LIKVSQTTGYPKEKLMKFAVDNATDCQARFRDTLLVVFCRT